MKKTYIVGLAYLVVVALKAVAATGMIAFLGNGTEGYWILAENFLIGAGALTLRAAIAKGPDTPKTPEGGVQ